MKETVKRIKAIKEYLKYYPDDRTARENLAVCEYADVFGIDPQRKSEVNYPMMAYGYFELNPQIKIGKKYRLTNSCTGYQQDREETLVIWRAVSGRLDFTSGRYWHDIEDEWQEFMNVLKSYEPLDYDWRNNVYVYDVEHGKKLIEDYDKILSDFKTKINKKIAKAQLEEKRKQFEKLRKELESADNA